jgi:hypothetical protein
MSKYNLCCSNVSHARPYKASGILLPVDAVDARLLFSIPSSSFPAPSADLPVDSYVGTSMNSTVLRSSLPIVVLLGPEAEDTNNGI